jgi:uncharacterized circularly permuted ATP-grasp superfamily protein
MGPDYGVHTIFWSDSKTAFDRYLNNDIYSEFSQRIVFRTNEEESYKILGNALASKLKSGTAYFYSDICNSMQKFRVYDIQTNQWKEWAVNKIKEVIKNDEWSFSESR